MAVQDYFSYLLNPLELLRTKKVLQVNPTVVSKRAEPEETKLTVYDYNTGRIDIKALKKAEDCFPYIDPQTVSWINVDGLRKDDVEAICKHFGVHYLITEDILSLGQRPKMDEIDGLLFCLLNMLYFNDKDSAVEIEQISIVLGKNFVISFQEDATRDVFNPLRERLKVGNTKVRQNGGDFLFYAQLFHHHIIIINNHVNQGIK